MDKEESILIQAGLSEEQALTYQSLLDKGPQKASALSKWTGIKRGLMYKILEQLENIGLIQKKGGAGTVATFFPNHPSLLISKMEHDKKQLDVATESVKFGLSNFISKFNLLSGKPNVRFYEGEDAIKNITGDYPKVDKEIRQWIDISYSMKIIENQTVNYLTERIKKGISKRMLISDSRDNREYAKKGTGLTEFGISKNNLPTAIQVYDDTIAMLTLNEENKIGFIIENPAVAQTLKNIFDEAWGNAEKINSTPPSLDQG